jgi:hypothetical protein
MQRFVPSRNQETGFFIVGGGMGWLSGQAGLFNEQGSVLCRRVNRHVIFSVTPKGSELRGLVASTLRAGDEIVVKHYRKGLRVVVGGDSHYAIITCSLFSNTKGHSW